MSDFRLYPATPIDGAAPAPAPRWQPNGPDGALAVVEGFSVWVERHAAGGFTVHYLGRTSPPVPSQAEAQALAPAFARRVIRERLQVNHALAADVYHTAERRGWAAPPLAPVMVPIAARAHARQAGRHDALAGEDLAAASGHVSAFPALRAAYQGGLRRRRGGPPRARRPGRRPDVRAGLPDRARRSRSRLSCAGRVGHPRRRGRHLLGGRTLPGVPPALL
ncbi:hypothetical protein [Burkholderia gladioli]|uniref:hypothetical protein n=1 Tax=Burkholderia gladioli TaxID=28095 RepID=UPI0016415770|nr:hypothetical protein [Burkholderia gladioli]MBU9170859.1 hypothetical protein [Burkholderia gladioli]MBU9385444.1 hypothetical protein [Burkholderia gladioli]MDN7807270.1 hypothetical protein [Burkholderia gladioli]